MAYEIIGRRFDKPDNIDPIGDKGPDGAQGVQGDKGNDEVPAAIITPFQPLTTEYNSENITNINTATIGVSTNQDNKTYVSSSITGTSDDLVWWRGSSGAPGVFSNFKVIFEDNGEKFHFEADYTNPPTEPLLPIYTFALFEYII